MEKQKKKVKIENNTYSYFLVCYVTTIVLWDE